MLLLLLLLLILLLCVSYLLSGKDILAPSVLACTVFIISFLFAFINIDYWGINYSSKTFFIMFLGIISFVIPGYFYTVNQDGTGSKFFSNSRLIIPSRYLLYFFLVIDLIITFFYIKDVYRISIIGGNNMGIAGMAGYYRGYTASSNDAEKLSGIMNQFLKLSRALGFVSIFILSYNSQIKRDFKRDRILYIFVLLTIAQNIIGGGRGLMLWLAGTSFSITYICNMAKYDWKNNINFNYIKKGLKIFLIILLIFYILKYFIRIGNSVNSFIDYISYYAGGSIENFNLYIKYPPTDSKLLWGQETLMGIYSTLDKFKLLDISNIYLHNSNLEFRYSENGIVLGNVYGAIRRYYNDFGILGMMVLQVMCSLFYNSYYRKIKLGKVNDFRWSILLYSYLLYHVFEMAIDDVFYKSFISFNMLTSILILYIVYYLFVNISFDDHRIIMNGVK
ncbi:O-antigen polymerase [Streptococcus equinus]|uniref:O-antigen polymerase n=1 Tax=Streptococcus equinus TaxID=1335 RepID=UPI000941D071|nr:O-antigen polymerase [Streptococcus equinus]